MLASRSISARAAGVLAVAGVVLAFSLSSTLVKRAETPGVLLAFWRMVTITIAWNALLRARGHRITRDDVRRALLPGVCFGLNLAVFFAGATHNSVANAALIGALSPFLIVPLGARLFGEHHEPNALAFAVVAFAGVAVVLFSAPPIGDASWRGNAFGLLAMLLWVGYVVTTRRFRGDMEVATFMATVSPIGTVAVLPLALANGDVTGLTARGWTYMLILSGLIGLGGHGLLVFAQRTVAIGTIGIAQVVQPAMAVVWSFLLLGERLNGRQAAGIAVVVGGLAAFLVVNRRGEGEPARRRARRPDPIPR